MNHAEVSITPVDSGSELPDGFCAMLELNASRRARDAAVSWVEADAVHSLDWERYRSCVLTIASAFLTLGIETGDAVVISAANRAEHLIADLATVHCRAVTVTAYATLSPQQLQHVVSDCQPKILILENVSAFRRFAALEWVQDHRPRIVLLDTDGAADLLERELTSSWDQLVLQGERALERQREPLRARVASIRTDDAATYIYTSGTTGLSKGVILTHGALRAEVESMIRWGGLDFGFKSVSYLPLAHVVERLWSVYLAVRTSGHVMCCPDPGRLMELVRIHRPTFFMAVPRVWEKLRAAFEAALEKLEADGRGAAIRAAREALRLEFEMSQEDLAVPGVVQMDACRAREGILRDVRTDFGLDKAVMPSCSAAPLRPDVTRFFASLGIYIHQGYGLTETAGPAVADRPGKVRIGSVGLPLPGVEMCVAADGELLIRSAANTLGYRNLPGATAELYSAGGWLRTGDIGRIDDAGRVYVTDRKKELIVNSAGKNIAPTAIESHIAGHQFISQAIACGEGRAFIVALLTVDNDRLLAFASARGIAERDVARLVHEPRIVAAVQLLVDDANAFLSRPEQIKRFAILAKEWRVEEGEVTPTFKLKRRVIQEKYRSVIEDLYRIEHGIPSVAS